MKYQKPNSSSGLLSPGVATPQGSGRITQQSKPSTLNSSTIQATCRKVDTETVQRTIQTGK